MSQDKKCTARSKRSGERCKRDPTPGATVCASHGGRAPQVKASATRRLALVALREKLADLEPEPIDPIAALLHQLGLASAWERWLRNEVAALDTVDAAGIGGSRKAAVEIELWNDERDRVAKLAKTALDAGIAERQVQIAERQGALIAEVIRKMLDDPELGLSAEQRQAGRLAASRHLRLLAS